MGGLGNSVSKAMSMYEVARVGMSNESVAVAPIILKWFMMGF